MKFSLLGRKTTIALVVFTILWVGWHMEELKMIGWWL